MYISCLCTKEVYDVWSSTTHFLRLYFATLCAIEKNSEIPHAMQAQRVLIEVYCTVYVRSNLGFIPCTKVTDSWDTNLTLF